MKTETIMTRFAGLAAIIGLAVAGCADLGADASDNAGIDEKQGAIVRPTATGGRNEVVMLHYLAGFNASGQPVYGACSGAYFAPRTVLTAAHCVQQIVGNQLFIYYGDNFAADVAQLTPSPAPPTCSRRRRASPRSGPRRRAGSSTPSGTRTSTAPTWPRSTWIASCPSIPCPWRASAWTTPGSAGRSPSRAGAATSPPAAPPPPARASSAPALTHFLGSPTAADYHPEDPNPGMLNATVRANTFKIDGRAPNSNACFGDSGSPLLVTQFGQTYIAGIEYFGGLSCEEYSLYHRIDPFLPFMDLAYMKGGQAVLAPRTECIAPRTGGGFRAYFGYNNQNGISVDIPRGNNNSFPQDTANLRPTHFLPGNHAFEFAVNFTAGQTLSYRVIAPNGPNTLLTVTQNSPRCNVNDPTFVCTQRCEAEQQAQCGWNVPDCTRDCVSNYPFLAPCESFFTAYNRCLAGLPASGFVCDDIFAFDANGVCDPKINDLIACLGG